MFTVSILKLLLRHEHTYKSVILRSHSLLIKIRRNKILLKYGDMVKRGLDWTSKRWTGPD